MSTFKSACDNNEKEKKKNILLNITSPYLEKRYSKETLSPKPRQSNPVVWIWQA